MLRTGVSGSQGSCKHSSLKNPHAVPHYGYTNLHSHQQSRRVPAAWYVLLSAHGCTPQLDIHIQILVFFFVFVFFSIKVKSYLVYRYVCVCVRVRHLCTFIHQAAFFLQGLLYCPLSVCSTQPGSGPPLAPRSLQGPSSRAKRLPAGPQGTLCASQAPFCPPPSCLCLRTQIKCLNVRRGGRGAWFKAMVSPGIQEDEIRAT